MKLLDYEIKCSKRSEAFSIFPIGDSHIGARDCAEKKLRRFVVNKIAANKNAYWIGGGDYCEHIKPQDVKRYEFDNLPDWLLDQEPDDIREGLRDICRVQRNRFCDIVDCVKSRCLGLIEGNHEYAIKKHHNQDIQGDICWKLNATDLTSEAFVRIKFKRGQAVQTVLIFITHGRGGGRSAGAEPNKLYELSTMFDADIILRGDSHTFCIMPPQVRLTLPRKGALPDELVEREIRAANWGCWRRSYAAGASTYTSRALYRPRPLNTIEVQITPHINGLRSPRIVIKEAAV